MKKTSIKETYDSPFFIFFFQFITYIIATIVVLIVGVFSALYFKDFVHLGRAGAVITLIAIGMAYKDFYLDLRNMSFDEMISLFGKEKIFEIWVHGFVHKKHKELEKLKPGFTKEDALDLLNKIKLDGYEKPDPDKFIQEWVKEMFAVWSKKLRAMEFRILQLGTLLWAFSDLINRPLGW